MATLKKCSNNNRILKEANAERRFKKLRTGDANVGVDLGEYEHSKRVL